MLNIISKTAMALMFASALSMGACTQFNTQVADPLLKDLAQIANTAQTDLQNVENVANAATPPDTDGATCAAAVITVLGQIQKVNAADTTANAGVFTIAEMASLFQPGSAQYNQAQNTIATGCISKANDVLGAANVVALGGVASVLPKLLPLAAAG